MLRLPWLIEWRRRSARAMAIFAKLYERSSSRPSSIRRKLIASKVKRPFELAISAIRTLGADTTGGPQLHQWIARMGEPLYGFQTPNGYSDTAEAWVNTGGLLELFELRTDTRKQSNSGNAR